MENSPPYEIKWTGHIATLKNSLFNCLVDTNFSDIVLCSEGTFIPCHKVILAATSNYFQNLFKSNVLRDSRERPIVIFNNIRMVDLVAVLNYAYTGTVEIPYDQLNMFIYTAKFLEMKGLENHQQMVQYQGQQSSSMQAPQPSIQVLHQGQQSSSMQAPQPGTSMQAPQPGTSMQPPRSTSSMQIHEPPVHIQIRDDVSVESRSQQTSTAPVQLPSLQGNIAEQVVGLDPEPPTPNRVDQVFFGLPESNNSMIELVPFPPTVPDMSLNSSNYNNQEFQLLEVENIPVQESASSGKALQKSGRRQVKVPSYLSSFQVESNRVQPRTSRQNNSGCKFCGVDTSQMPGGSKIKKLFNHEMQCVQNPNRGKGKIECPFCRKFFTPSYVTTHVRKIHPGSVLNLSTI